jgi:hypothetical protein
MQLFPVATLVTYSSWEEGENTDSAFEQPQLKRLAAFYLLFCETLVIYCSCVYLAHATCWSGHIACDDH